MLLCISAWYLILSSRPGHHGLRERNAGLINACGYVAGSARVLAHYIIVQDNGWQRNGDHNSARHLGGVDVHSYLWNLVGDPNVCAPGQVASRAIINEGRGQIVRRTLLNVSAKIVDRILGMQLVRLFAVLSRMARRSGRTARGIASEIWRRCSWRNGFWQITLG